MKNKNIKIGTINQHFTGFKGFLYEMHKNSTLYSMFIPAAIVLFLFNYLPMFGLLTAFKDFNFREGILGSPFIKPIYGNFKYLFSTGSALRATRNTVGLNLLFILFELVIEVGCALLFAELHNKKFKNVAQFSIFLPYFISWIVVGLFSYNLFNYEHGSLNNLLSVFGLDPVNWYSNASMWIVILVIFRIWKMAGYGMVMYIAALGSIDSTFYEVAEINGATRWQRIRYVSIPLIAPTIITLLLLNCGKIMNADFGMFYAMIGDNAQLYRTTDVLDTFIYRSLRLNGDVGMASAAGFYQSILSTSILLLMNKLARKYNPEGALF
ncbi:ABC transporter permease subunit [uncultured Sphaerochaeta sp.]|uniref:ABC transporter permease n=1 Tax=uncultured Sphaerochaeta sp. TaxID=886478 RepID=UPI002A0A9BBF|nr:ABC transporter permease subunit [uncultured Sphaerochaeta sp.]